MIYAAFRMIIIDISLQKEFVRKMAQPVKQKRVFRDKYKARFLYLFDEQLSDFVLDVMNQTCEHFITNF